VSNSKFILVRTPLRISFFGGGSDYPDHYNKFNGAVLSTTINKYIYQSFRFVPPFGEVKHKIVWRHVEIVDTISEILHPSVREGLNFLKFDNKKGIEISYQADLPGRTGMGSSSSFTVGLINGLSALKGQYLDNKKITDLALELEQNVLKESVGSQDQIAASYGGLNLIEFNKETNYKVNPIDLNEDIKNEFLSHLILVYTGSTRFSSEITEILIKSLKNKEKLIKHLHHMAYEGLELLKNGNIISFGKLLDESWSIKTQLSHNITNNIIDDIYNLGKKKGAVGGKLLGAGSSGFILFVVPKNNRKSFINEMEKKFKVVEFDFDQHGTKIIYKD
jgi:D-glycero-alpha-D-manno-heptose-7-phosphate kinase